MLWFLLTCTLFGIPCLHICVKLVVLVMLPNEIPYGGFHLLFFKFSLILCNVFTLKFSVPLKGLKINTLASWQQSVVLCCECVFAAAY